MFVSQKSKIFSSKWSLKNSCNVLIVEEWGGVIATFFLTTSLKGVTSSTHTVKAQITNVNFTADFLGIWAELLYGVTHRNTA